MKQFLSAIAIIAISMLVFSCSREEHQYIDPALQELPAAPLAQQRAGGEDDDKQIVIHRVYTSSQVSIAGASVTMVGVYSKPDTITGTTNAFGECSLELPKVGAWSVLIEREGYQSSQQLIIVSDSVSTRNVTLEPEN